MHDRPIVRAFEPDDAQAVARLIERTIDASYTGVYPPRAIRFFKQLHSPGAILRRHADGVVLVAEQGGRVIATGSLMGDEITGVFVQPESQRCGVGGRIMDRLEGMARAGGHATVRLSVSLPSRGFYEGRGYELQCRSADMGEGERLDYWEAAKSLESADS